MAKASSPTASAQLTAEKRVQFNAYHARMLAVVGPLVGAVLWEWLAAVCAAV